MRNTATKKLIIKLSIVFMLSTCMILGIWKCLQGVCDAQN